MSNIKYRMWKSLTGSSFQYHYKYFDSINEALEEAKDMEAFGLIEQWEVEEFEGKKDDLIDIECMDFGLFDYTNAGYQRQQWYYKTDEGLFYCPGFLFNHYKNTIDTYITLEEIYEIVVDKDEKKPIS